MKFNKWLSVTAASVLLATSFTVTNVASAEETKSITDESIYDLLVDRFFNGSAQNDLHVDPKDPAQFSGGDFKGISEKLSLIKKDMGFSIASIGSVFTTEKYDGSLVTSYSEIEPHFGTAEELKQLIQTAEQSEVSIMIDFPLTNVSENHEWTKDASKADWVVGTSNGKVRWDLKTKEVQQALIEQIVNFVSTYKVGGVRLTNLDIADTAFLNEIIEAIKEVDENIYVISNEDSDADFDATYYEETNKIFRNIYKNVDQDSSEQVKYIERFVQNEEAPTQLMFDNLKTDRFTLDVEAYPPTRVKLATASTLLLPGVPVMQYGTEIVMNGEVGSESHQLYNFRTDKEIVEFIGNIQTIRNQSETLRNGDFKLIKNENGFLAFERYSDDERWIVVINNTGKTTRVDVSEDDIGVDKELHGMLEDDIIRENDEGVYPIVLDREVVEIFQVTEKRGINTSYIIALGLVYILFTAFIFAIIKRGRRQRAQEN